MTRLPTKQRPLEPQRSAESSLWSLTTIEKWSDIPNECVHCCWAYLNGVITLKAIWRKCPVHWKC